MTCYHPLKANRDSNGVRVLPGDAVLYNMRLPCGQCVGCRLERSRQWALRCVHEASLHDYNCFITLTYDVEFLPEGNSLDHRHWQLFMKRLRKHFSGVSIRYYGSGEYGTLNGRPHFHAILFGVLFSDLVYWKKTKSGSRLYRSETLERLWPYGFSSVGTVTFESAAYVARYIMAKVTGSAAADAYTTVQLDTGEIFSRRPEYNFMSLKPGIGADWFDKFKSDVFPHDRVVRDGVETRVPRYYDKLLKRVDPEQFDIIKDNRVIDAEKNLMDNTYSRLKVKGVVTEAAISILKRGLT